MKLTKQQLDYLKLLSQNKSRAEIKITLGIFQEDQMVLEVQCMYILGAKNKEQMIKRYYEYLLEMEF